MSLRGPMGTRWFSFTCRDGKVEHIFLRWKGTNKLLVVRARRIIRHIEIEDHLVAGLDLGIDVPPSLIRISPVRLILEWDKQRVTQNRLEHFNGMLLPVEFKMEPAVPNIAFIRSLVGQESGVVFRVVDVE